MPSSFHAVPFWLQELLTELKDGLRSLYGEQLQGVFLYGSHARREAESGSDVDVLVVLDHLPHYCAETERTSELVSTLSLRHDVSISQVFLAVEEWRQQESPFLVSVSQDAIAA